MDLVAGPDDAPLWLRARAGDAGAFAGLFERHVDAVYTHCRRRGESVADAEDVTSLVFLEAWRKAAAVRIVNGSVRPWLLVVATNVLRNQWRARARHKRLLAQLPRERAHRGVVPADGERPGRRLLGVRSAGGGSATALTAASRRRRQAGVGRRGGGTIWVWMRSLLYRPPPTSRSTRTRRAAPSGRPSRRPSANWPPNRPS